LGTISNELLELTARLLREAGLGPRPDDARQLIQAVPSAPIPGPKPQPKLSSAAAARFHADDEAIAKKLGEQRALNESRARVAAEKAAAAVAAAKAAETLRAKSRARLTAGPSDADKKLAASKQMLETIRSSTPPIEKRPIHVRAATSKAICDAIALGSEIVGRASGPDFDNGYIIGFDLGTSSLKCAVRQPYTADDPVKALGAPPELRSGEHPCLWQTVVWFHPETERFTLYPVQGSLALGGFKTGLIGGQGNGFFSKKLPITKAEAAVAFTALQLAYFI